MSYFDDRVEIIADGINQKRMETGNRQKEIFDEVRELEPTCREMA